MLNVVLKMIIKILPIVGFLLLIPLIAMLFTGEVNWSFFDFTIMGILLTTTGILIGITLKIVKSNNKYIIILTISLLFLLIWAELAVGLFGTPFAGN
jgi:hypothetical protein